MADSIPFHRLMPLENYGHSLKAACYLYRPGVVEEILDLFETAKQTGLTITTRGAGRSYNDASLNGGGIVLDMQRMNVITAWDPETGIVTAEPGVCLRELWQKVLPDGWWPPVVSGTMSTTLGGCLGANVHGKNNFRMGTIGEHVLEFTALLPTGAEITCSPKKNGDLFHSMIGGLGMLGIFTSITLQMKKLHSGLLRVHAHPLPNLENHLQTLLEAAPEHDYTVGWLDTMARGRSLGRGQLHAANYLHEGEDPSPKKTLALEYQHLPDRIFGVVPKSLLHYFMAPFMNNFGVWGVNTAKYFVSLQKSVFLQSHAGFHFLFDYLPNWERAYGRGGLIQHQSFLPKETAVEAWREMLTMAQKRGLPSYLGVTKRHRPDKFLLSHAVDGFSLALDFKVTRNNKARLESMLQEFDKIVLQAGGRFYFAKNSETRPDTTRRFLGDATMAQFIAFKKRCDPRGLLESDLYRRVFKTG